MPILSDAELDTLHRHFFETAKQNVLRHGSLQPVVMLAFESETPAEDLKALGLSVARTAGGPQAIAVVLVSHAPTALVDMLLQCSPEIGRHLRFLRESAPKDFNAERRDGVIIRTFCEVNRTSEPDILAHYLKWLAEKLDAYALWKIDEAYTATVGQEEAEERMRNGGAPVKDTPGRRECLIASLETRTRTGMIMALLQRQDPADETSKPVGFTDEKSSYEKLEGRFFGLLRRSA